MTAYFNETDKIEDIYYFVEDNLEPSEKECAFKIHSFFPTKDFPRSSLVLLQSGLFLFIFYV